MLRARHAAEELLSESSVPDIQTVRMKIISVHTIRPGTLPAPTVAEEPAHHPHHGFHSPTVSPTHSDFPRVHGHQVLGFHRLPDRLRSISLKAPAHHLLVFQEIVIHPDFHSRRGSVIHRDFRSLQDPMPVLASRVRNPGNLPRFWLVHYPALRLRERIVFLSQEDFPVTVSSSPLEEVRSLPVPIITSVLRGFVLGISVFPFAVMVSGKARNNVMMRIMRMETDAHFPVSWNVPMGHSVLRVSVLAASACLGPHHHDSRSRKRVATHPGFHSLRGFPISVLVSLSHPAIHDPASLLFKTHPMNVRRIQTVRVVFV